MPTLVVVVIGDVTPVTVWETLYCAILILTGLVVNAAVIGSIADLVASLDSAAAKFRQVSPSLSSVVDVARKGVTWCCV
jgi:hypothetical protein